MTGIRSQPSPEKRPSGGQQLRRKSRFRHQARNVSSGIAFLHIGSVIVRKRFPEGNALPFQPVIEIADIGHGHIAAAASAFHIVEAALSEQGNPAAGSQREQSIPIFQQYHAFLGGLPGKCDVLRTGRYTISVL